MVESSGFCPRLMELWVSAERLSLIVTLILTRGVALALPCLSRYDVCMICINCYSPGSKSFLYILE